MTFRTFFAVAAVALGCSTPELPPLPAGGADALIPLPAVVERDSLQPDVAVRGVAWHIAEVWADSLGCASDWVFPAGEPSGDASTAIRIERAAGYAPEGYALTIGGEGIAIEASAAAGAFRALTTLRQLAPADCERPGRCPDGWTLPAVHIEDAPQYAHRGLLLDVCRHFMEVAFVEQVLDGLALHKFNTLHWHLTEDQGWRIQIEAYPKLTETGAWRTEDDGSTHGGFYTKEDIRHLVEYAAQRHITIIPEIELPGHSRAALAAYPELGCTGEALPVPNDWGVYKDIYCAGDEQTFAFLEQVLTEVLELFPSEYIHIGGDEAPKVRWEACAKCQRRMHTHGLPDEHALQSYFIGRIGDWLAERGRKIIGWDEILEGGLPEGATVQSWRGLDGARAAIASGHDAILSPTSHCYLDYPLEATDLEEVYGFNPGEVSGGPGRVLGGEVNLWSEHAPQHLVESKVYPRATAFAEVMWTAPERRNFEGFLDRLDAHYDRMDRMGIDYGLETVPVEMTAEVTPTGVLQVRVDPAMRGVSGVAGFVPKGAQQSDTLRAWGETFTVEGEGQIMTEVEHRYRLLTEPPRFPVAGHVGLTAPTVQIDHALNPYYPGGGERGLVDGLLGSHDFRDGRWQAVSGEDMAVFLSWPDPMHIDSITFHTYLYQNAWIFNPARIEVQWCVNGSDVWEAVEIFPEAPLARNDKQGIERWSAPVNSHAWAVRVELKNPGRCPDWHDAATEPTWMFLDEVVVHGRPRP